jgi:hypothetical protein
LVQLKIQVTLNDMHNFTWATKSKQRKPRESQISLGLNNKNIENKHRSQMRSMLCWTTNICELLTEIIAENFKQQRGRFNRNNYFLICAVIKVSLKFPDANYPHVCQIMAGNSWKIQINLSEINHFYTGMNYCLTKGLKSSSHPKKARFEASPVR